jgi:hypothetical protein
MAIDNAPALVLLLLAGLVVLIPLLAFGFVVSAIWMGLFLAAGIAATLLRKFGVRRRGGSAGRRPETIDMEKEGTTWRSR